MPHIAMDQPATTGDEKEPVLRRGPQRARFSLAGVVGHSPRGLHGVARPRGCWLGWVRSAKPDGSQRKKYTRNEELTSCGATGGRDDLRQPAIPASTLDVNNCGGPIAAGLANR